MENKLVKENGGEAMTLSTTFAKFFNLNHAEVIQKIEDIAQKHFFCPKSHSGKQKTYYFTVYVFTILVSQFKDLPLDKIEKYLIEFEDEGEEARSKLQDRFLESHAKNYRKELLTFHEIICTYAAYITFSKLTVDFNRWAHNNQPKDEKNIKHTHYWSNLYSELLRHNIPYATAGFIKPDAANEYDYLYNN